MKRFNCHAACILFAWFGAMANLTGDALFAEEPVRPAISLHPENSKYFLFRGKPLVLIAATEHYGSVVNRAFDFEKYLDDAADKHQTVTRTFLLFREQQSARNPYSPIKPESPDFVTPWPRTGPGTAIDGEPKYDLDKWNSEYFDRLHRFLRKASEVGVVVELTVFSNTYGDPVWALNPLKTQNNLQGVGKGSWADYNSLKDPDLLARQIAHARKIVQETARYDNVYYEICNEPGGGTPNHATPADVDAWQRKIAQVIREELDRLDSKHLISGSQAFSYDPKFTQPLDASFADMPLDVVNVHPLPDTILGGRAYMLGQFMSRELKLREFADFCRATQSLPKPAVHDEDNCASMYRDDTGWTIHRKRAWTAVLSQMHYDYIDFSIIPGSETGTKESNRKIRTWMKHLSDVIHSFDCIHAQPLNGWLSASIAHTVCVALGKPGEDYLVYLGDSREITEAYAGEPIETEVSFRLPEGGYSFRTYSPVTGEYSSPTALKGGPAPISLRVGPFKHDLLLRITRNPQ